MLHLTPIVPVPQAYVWPMELLWKRRRLHTAPLSTGRRNVVNGDKVFKDPECECKKKQKREVEERQMGRGGSLKTLKWEGCVNHDA